MSLDRARDWLVRAGLPGGDPAEAPTSTSRFADGGWYKWEVAGALDAASVVRLTERLAPHGVRLHQATNTVGTMRYLDPQLTDLVQACRDLGVQLRMAVGPRGLFDIGGQKLATGVVAAASAYRLRGTDQLAQAVDDVAHAVDLGVRGFLVFDEGLLSVLARLRADGVLPPELRLKASSNMGAANPAHARLLAEAGADSVNLQRDLDVRMIAAVRQATPVALDLHTDNPRGTGGFVRGYDVPEIVRVGAPVYLKSGNAAQDFSDEAPSERQCAAIVHQILLDDQLLRRLFAEAVPSDRPEF
ncbi:U32 family peptidase [Dactylosporangium sp. AC04546]|uniref:U32 family peptidase n=1 Tax=Dactylosporangium sp. AC04546 TaxID=2862460 RepID=UPI001EDF70CD|nr:U32 family peptidase [Dactylosporangium sp. AC04546]WVK78590.1 U32 family peptidase [Dactylosporangium sp. AC04546]